MIRFATVLTFTAALTAVAGQSAYAKSKQEKLCEEFAAMSQQLANLRIKGATKDAARDTVAGQYKASQVDHLQMVPTLTEFVYGLSKKDLKGDIEGEFASQCKGYKG